LLNCDFGFAGHKHFGSKSANVRAFITVGIQSVVEDLAAHWEQTSGNKVDAVFSTSAGLLKRIAADEQADLFIGTRAHVDSLIKDGKLAAPGISLGGSAVGIAIRKGAPRPDISTPESGLGQFWRTSPSNNSCAMKGAARKHRAAAVRARIDSGSADGLSWPALVLVPPCPPHAPLGLWDIGTNDIDVELVQRAAELRHPVAAGGADLVDPECCVLV